MIINECQGTFYRILAALPPLTDYEKPVASPDESDVGLEWHSVHLVAPAAGTRKMDLPPNSDYMLFNNDLTYENKEDNHIEKGAFTYNETDRKITFSVSGNKYTVKEISATELALDFVTEGTPGTFIFKPVK